MASKDIISYPSLTGHNMSSDLPHNWQNDLMKGIEGVEHEMDYARERIANNPKIIAEHVKALESVRKAKEDVAHFIGVYNDELH
jgi:hypothetical protein